MFRPLIGGIVTRNGSRPNVSTAAPSPEAAVDILGLQEQLLGLREQVTELEAQNAALRIRIEQLEQEKRLLQDQLDEARRTAARQAAPFRRPPSRKIPEAQKKRPGRKPGHPGVYRARPDHVDEHVEVPLRACPGCGGPVTRLEPVEQFLEEIPPIRPHVTHLITYKGLCPTAARSAANIPSRCRRPPALPRFNSAPAPRPWPSASTSNTA